MIMNVLRWLEATSNVKKKKRTGGRTESIVARYVGG